MYVVIAGNTGAGKSALGIRLAEALRQFLPVQYVDEKEFHHEQIQKMFDRPEKYAYPIQMNFLLQRTLRILDLIEKGVPFILERSLVEDHIFAKRHAELGAISQSEYGVYQQFWKYCNLSVPQPLGYIYLWCDDPAVLTARVIKGNKSSRRRQELPEDELLEFANDLNKRYEQWYLDLNDNKIRIPIFVDGFEMTPWFDEIVEFVQRCFLKT